MSHAARRAVMLLPFLEIGGADKFNLDLARQLVRRHGWQLTIALTLPSANPWRPLFEALTADIVALHPRVAPADQPAFLRDLLRSRQADTLLLSHSELGYALLPFLRAHCPGVALLDYLHMEEERWRGGGYPRFSLDQAAWLDLSVTSSEHLRGWMLARGANPTRVAVCTTNIDAADWDPARFDRERLRRELGVPPDDAVILSTARLVPQKQPRVLADVARRLERQGLRFTLLVAGDGPERAWVEDFARRERLTSLRLLGAVSGERVRELMAASDIFFLPSQYEGISLALFEAMAMGLAPVTADVGGQRELLTPACGVLVRRGPREQQEYASALARLIAGPELRAAMGAASRRRVAEEFQLDQMGDRMVELVEQAHRLAQSAPRAVGPEQAAASAERGVRSPPSCGWRARCGATTRRLSRSTSPADAESRWRRCAVRSGRSSRPIAGRSPGTSATSRSSPSQFARSSSA
jgi:glycosyltransferase involved in cell wall biosynthesis